MAHKTQPTDKKKVTDPLDIRRFNITWYPPAYALHIPTQELVIGQRDLRIILKHLKGRNKFISDKIIKFIKVIDGIEKKDTNWDSYVPRTGYVMEY